MQETIDRYGEYTDGKEIFDELSTEMISFLNIYPLEHVMLDNYLYRLNKQEI